MATKPVIVHAVVHDGYIFHFTQAAVNAGQDIVGYYFDELGYPQPIYRTSLYGEHILTWLGVLTHKGRQQKFEEENPYTGEE